MPSITVRDVPDEARNELAARAARSGRSLQEYLRNELIELARRPDASALGASIRAGKERSESRITPEEILAFRDAGRR
ncbi:MAG: FitA-like ribbon-helix-helix domain-containing protein [Actinomycetota bacterium]